MLGWTIQKGLPRTGGDDRKAKSLIALLVTVLLGSIGYGIFTFLKMSAI